MHQVKVKGFKQIISRLLDIMLYLGLAGVFIAIFPEYSHLVLLALSILLFYFGYKWIAFYRKLNEWKLVDATIKSITESSIDEFESQYNTNTYLYPEIEYKYNYEGTEMTSDRVGYGLKNYWVRKFDYSGFENKRDAFFWSGWKEGDTIPIYVNPDSPENSVIINKLHKKRRSHYYALIVSSVLIFVIWVAIVL